MPYFTPRPAARWSIGLGAPDVVTEPGVSYKQSGRVSSSAASHIRQSAIDRLMHFAVDIDGMLNNSSISQGIGSSEHNTRGIHGSAWQTQ